MNHSEIEIELEKARQGYEDAVKDKDIYKVERFAESIEYLEKKLKELKEDD